MGVGETVIHFQFPRTKHAWTCHICGAQNLAGDIKCHACNDMTVTVNKAATHEPDPIETEKSLVVLDGVREDLELRAVKGNERYGTYLKTHNGRDALMDAYQEALDLVMYLKQALMERDQGSQ